MSPYPTQSEKPEMIGRIFQLVRDATEDEKWNSALVILAGVLLKKDEFTRERMLASVPAKLRRAFDDLQDLYQELVGERGGQLQ